MTGTISTTHSLPDARYLAPASMPSDRVSPGWTHTLAIKLFLIAVFLIPVQLEISSVRDLIGSRLPPGDIFLAFSLFFAPGSFRIIRRSVGYLPLALPLVLGYGAIVSLTLQGYLTQHSLNVKFLGSAVLVVMGVLTMAYAREGMTPRILRSFLFGISFWGAVGYVDWRVFDIMPWLEVDVESRFGGMQFDPNNAGALFAAALLISWRYGIHIYRHRWAWVASTIWFAMALGFTLSRGAFVGTAAALVVVLTVDHVSAEKAMRYAVAAVVIGAILFGTGFVDDATNDFSRRPDTVESRGSFIDTGIERWVDSRGLGMGLGTFRAETTRIIHNTGVWLVVEMSLPGLLLFLALVVVPFQACLRMRSYDHELAMAILAAHMTMVVASVGIEALYQRGWWLFIGLSMLPTESIRREQTQLALAAHRRSGTDEER